MENYKIPPATLTYEETIKDMTPSISIQVILNKIDTAKQNRKCYVEIPGNVSETIMQKFREAGYVVYYNDFESKLNIEWVYDYQTLRKLLTNAMDSKQLRFSVKCGVSDKTLTRIRKTFPHVTVTKLKNEVLFDWS